MTQTPDLAFLRRIASNPRGFTPSRPSDVWMLDALVRAGYVVKVDAGRWCVTQAGLDALNAQEVVK